MDREAKILNKALGDIRDVLATLQGGFSKEQFADVLALVTLHLEKPKGDKGDMPSKEELEAVIDPLIPKHVPERFIPQKGVDYYTDEDTRVLVERIMALIHTPKVGEDYFTEEDKKSIVATAVEIVKSGILPNASLAPEEWTRIEEMVKAVEPGDLSRFVIGVGTRTLTVAPTAPEDGQEGDLWVAPKTR